MPSVFVYEFVSGGGMWQTGEAPSGSLLAEGAAMRRALIADFLRGGFAVATTRDTRFTGREKAEQVVAVDGPDAEIHALLQLAQQCDWSLIIAPEFSGHLTRRAELIERAADNLLGCSDCCRLFSNKQSTCDWLEERGFHVPEGTTVDRGAGPPFDPPIVSKPVDGAGSVDIRSTLSEADWLPPKSAVRVERLVAGVPVCVTILCGPHRHRVLPCTRQRLTDDGCFRYLGGELPVDPHVARRASETATRLAEVLPTTLKGVIGVDMVVGERVYVVDVNPRATTSYLGLTRACKRNLAQALIEAANGEECELEFDLTKRICFSP